MYACVQVFTYAFMYYVCMPAFEFVGQLLFFCLAERLLLSKLKMLKNLNT